MITVINTVLGITLVAVTIGELGFLKTLPANDILSDVEQ